jgi:hypothetical protein
MKSPSFLLVIVMFCMGSSACKKSPTQDTVRTADRLAAHPDDLTKPDGVRGVSDAKLASADTIEAAVKACVEAIKADPKEPRYEFELGRVLLLGGMVEEAREHLEAAAQQGHAAAYFYLGGLELDTARGFFNTSAAGNFKPAHRLVSDLRSIGAFEPRPTPWRLWLVGFVALVSVALLVAWVLRRRRRLLVPAVNDSETKTIV